MENEIIIDWEPQPRQLVALSACGLDSPFTGESLKPAIADLFGSGGAAGGGKTDTLLAIGITGSLAYSSCVGLVKLIHHLPTYHSTLPKPAKTIA